MPSFTATPPTAADDACANAEGAFTAVNQIDIGSIPAGGSTDNQGAFYFEGFSIPRYDVIDAATFTFGNFNSPSSSITVQVYLYAAVSPAMPTTNPGLRGAALTSAKVEMTYTSSMVIGTHTIDIAPMLREQVQKGTISRIVVLLKDKNAPVGNNRLRINSQASSTPATISVTHSTPPAVTGEATAPSSRRRWRRLTTVPTRSSTSVTAAG